MTSQANIASTARKIARKSGINPVQPMEKLLADLWQAGLLIDLFLEFSDRLENEREIKREYRLEY